LWCSLAAVTIFFAKPLKPADSCLISAELEEERRDSNELVLEVVWEEVGMAFGADILICVVGDEVKIEVDIVIKRKAFLIVCLCLVVVVLICLCVWKICEDAVDCFA